MKNYESWSVANLWQDLTKWGTLGRVLAFITQTARAFGLARGLFISSSGLALYRSNIRIFLARTVVNACMKCSPLLSNLVTFIFYTPGSNRGSNNNIIITLLGIFRSALCSANSLITLGFLLKVAICTVVSPPSFYNISRNCFYATVCHNPTVSPHMKTQYNYRVIFRYKSQS